MNIALLAACLATLAAGHSSLVSPISRNAVDRNLPPWQGGRFGNNQSCAHPSGESRNNAATRARFGLCWGCNCVNSTGTCDVAQTCLWVSVACRSVFFLLLFSSKLSFFLGKPRLAPWPHFAWLLDRLGL